MESPIIDQNILIDGSALSISWRKQGLDDMLMQVIWNSTLYVSEFKKGTESFIQAQKLISHARIYADTIVMENIDDEEITATIPKPGYITRKPQHYDVEIDRGVMYVVNPLGERFGQIILSAEMRKSLNSLMIQAVIEPHCNNTLIVTHDGRQCHLGGSV